MQTATRAALHGPNTSSNKRALRLLWMKSDFIIPPDTGGKIRTYNLLRELHKLAEVCYVSYKGHDAPNDEAQIQACASEVVTFHKPEEVKEGLGFYARVLAGAFSGLPYIVQKYRSAGFAAIQKDLYARGPDGPVVLCDFLEMAENVDWTLPCPKILFQHNVENLIWHRYSETEQNLLKKAYFHFEKRRLRRYEAWICNRFDLIFAVSANDKRIMQEDLGVSTPIEVLETGVDTDFFTPREEIQALPGRLLFLGSMDWMPNIDGCRWFVREIYPLIRARRPNVSLDIVGRRPVDMVRSLENADHRIRVIADVPDVRDYIARSDLFVVPLRVGGGTRIKIYEAMAMRRPVVATSIGAEGLPLADGVHLATADSPEGFSTTVLELLADGSHREQMAAYGYRFVKDNCAWSTVAQRMYAACIQASERNRR